MEEFQEELEKEVDSTNKKKLGEGTVTFYRLMAFQLEQARARNTDLVYLVIGTLRRNEVFVSSFWSLKKKNNYWTQVNIDITAQEVSL